MQECCSPQGEILKILPQSSIWFLNNCHDVFRIELGDSASWWRREPCQPLPSTARQPGEQHDMMCPENVTLCSETVCWHNISSSRWMGCVWWVSATGRRDIDMCVVSQSEGWEPNKSVCYSFSIREIRKVIEEEGDTVTVTIMMREVFIALVRGMSEWLVKNKMNHAWQDHYK